MKTNGSGPLLRRLAGCAVAALLACATLAGAAQQAMAADRVTIGALRFTSHAPGFIALEKGYFAAEGIEAELRFFQAAQPVAEAVAAGEVDFGVTALTGGFHALAEQGVVKVVAGLYTETAGQPGMAILASNRAHEAGLHGPADLAGRSWAATQPGSSFHYVAGRIAERHRIPPEEIRLVPLQQVDAMVAALRAGEVDATALVPQLAIPLDRAGEARIVGWVRDLGDWQVTAIFTSTAHAEQRPDLVRRFLRAYFRGVQDYLAAMLDPARDPAAADAVIDILHRHVDPEAPRDRAAAAILAGTVYMVPDGTLDLASLAHQLDWAKRNGLAPEGLTVERMVAPGFVP